MNYKAIGLNTLVEYAEQSPYSLGEILYSILREPVSGMKNFKDLREMSDEDIYTIIEKAKEIEEEK